MPKVNRVICPGDTRFEWINGELFVLMEQMHEDACWVKADLMHDIREAGAEIKGEPDVFIVERNEGKADKVHAVLEVIVFAGGDTLFYIDPEAMTTECDD